MGLLNRSQRQTLVDLLLRLPNIGDAATRNVLLTDLPPGLVNTIASANAPATHIANIVNAVNDDAWARLPDGTVPLLLLIENAIYMVQGSGLAAHLQTLHDTLQAAPAAPGGSTPAPADSPAPAPASPPTIVLTSLTGPQRKQLYDALLSAFPTPTDLARMVAFGLNTNLAQISTGSNLGDMALSLMTWAQAQGRMEDLVRAARQDNPGNAALQAFAQAAGVTA
jgi:effector-associated domain 1 (EAD1)-containing protein